MEIRLGEIDDSVKGLEERKAMSPWRRNTLYPCVLLLLLFVTVSVISGTELCEIIPVTLV